jgi:1-acyl-sn-glycerol-3-phosphate acyltransferase
VTFDPDALDRRDVRLIERLLPVVETVNRRYLRLVTDGLEHVPAGPALCVANHNGGSAGPDLACTLATLWRARGPAAPLFALAHDFAMRHFPPLGRALQKLGAVRAAPENARRIFAAGASALVYPGGDLEAYRASRDRDRIVLGERTGFVRIAQAAGVPIVPIVAHGAHRSAWILDDGRRIAEALRLHHWARLDRFPVALALPWGIGLGPWLPYLPLPFPIRLRVLPPIEAPPGEDPVRLREQVRARMQAALDDLGRS